MSKHRQVYSGLYAACKAARFDYHVAYARVRKGMSIADAVAKPVRECKTKPKPAPAIPPRIAARLFAWERPGYIAVKPSSRISLKPSGCIKINPSGARPSMTEVKSRKRYIPVANDTSPDRIRKLRRALCAEFVKFGTINQGLMAQLKDYADEVQRSKHHPERISPEHAATAVGSGQPYGSGDHGSHVAVHAAEPSR